MSTYTGKYPQGRKVFVLLVFVSQNSETTANIRGCCWTVNKTNNQLNAEAGNQFNV